MPIFRDLGRLTGLQSVTVKLALCFVPLFWLNSVQGKEYFEFNQVIIEAPFDVAQDPVSVNILPNYGKELILLGSKESILQLALYAFDNETQQYQLQQHIPLPKALFSFDISKSTNGEMDTLYFLASNKVVKFIPLAKQSFEDVVSVNSIYINDEADYLKKRDFISDLNDDGLPDIILADFHHLNVYINTKDEGFSKQQLPISPTVEMFDSSISYTENRYFLIDMTLDNKPDITLASNGELLVFNQQSDGSFNEEPLIIAVNSAISGVNWWDARGADGSNVDQSDLKHRTVEHIKDINNDGLADLVVQYTQSSGVLDKSNDYEIYLGLAKANQLLYHDEPSSVVKADGTLTDLDFIDINNDDQQEIMTSSFDISVSQIISALLTGSVEQDVLIYSLDARQHYKQRINKEVELTFSLRSGKSGSPVVTMVDLNGDGAKELILSSSEEKLNIYPGMQGDKLIQSKAQSVKIRLPKNGAMLSSDDLDQDGRFELFMRYGSEDGEKLKSNILVLKVN